MAPLEERLWRRVVKQDDGCWIWTGAKAYGYGRIGLGGRGDGTDRTHRVAYRLLVGPIPEGMDLDHLCRVTACCNPAHLEPVTRAENARRQAAAFRESNPRCPNGHEFTEDNTYCYPPKFARRCRTCANESRRFRYHERRQQEAA